MRYPPFRRRPRCTHSCPRDFITPLLLSVGLVAFFPHAGYALKPSGATYTTMVLKYYPSGASYWCMRVDPPEVTSFQLSISFDPARAALDTSFANNGVQFKFPYNGTIMFDADSKTYTVSGMGPPEVTAPGDADVFELKFLDLHPNDPLFPLDQAAFTVFATGTDFIGTYDPITGQEATILAADIRPTTRVATPGVSPLIWDPDGAYDNGHTGGPGVWNTSSLQWDNLPVPPVINPPFQDVAWNNSSNAHDIAVFGGDPGNGMVQIAVPISTGGFQFDNTGYNLIGAPLTLAAPAGSIPTIDTGENTATITSSMDGTAFKKVGTGTLILAGDNTLIGATIVAGGTLQNNGSLIDNVNVTRGTYSGTGSSGVLVIGDGLGADDTAAGLADAFLSPGNGSSSVGTLIAAGLNLTSDAVFRLTLDSTLGQIDMLQLSGGADLGSGVADLLASDLGNTMLPLDTVFTIIDNQSAAPTNGFFSGLPDGASFAIGVNQFEIDYGAGTNANDVQLKVVPEPGVWALLSLGMAAMCSARRQRLPARD